MGAPGGRTPEQRDLREKAELAGAFLDLTRCPRGRVQAQGYTCLWCNNDYTADGRCSNPDRGRREDELV